jgi:penicillin-binding protein 1A
MTKKATVQKSAFKKYTKWIWTIFLGGIGMVILIFLFASWGLLGKLPSFEELENPINNLATEVISSDGHTIGKYAVENRTPIGYKDLFFSFLLYQNGLNYLDLQHL